MIKIKFSDVFPHALAVLVFLVVVLAFFSPLFFENKELGQQDIQIGRASCRERVSSEV